MIVARIRSLISDGRFAGTVQEADDSATIGMTVFIPRVCPGELVRANIVKSNEKFLEADLVEIIESSPDRIVAPCEYFEQCGGCSLQHLPLIEQQKLKTELFHQTYRKITGQEWTGEFKTFQQTLGLGYRKRIGLHCKDGQIGFFATSSNAIVPITNCLIAAPALNDTLQVLLSSTEKLPNEIEGITLDLIDDKQVSVVLQVATKAKGFKPAVLAKDIKALPNLKVMQGKNELFSNLSRKSAAGHFSQVNPSGNSYLQDLLLSKITSPSSITELYAGGGNFTFLLAKKSKQVTAVELDPKLVQAAQTKIAKEQIKNVNFIRSMAEKFVAENALANCLVLDPPRAGAKEVLKKADFSKTKEVLYISCNPATFARDSQTLQSKGFIPECLELVDMFPQTAHIELLAKFRKA